MTVCGADADCPTGQLCDGTSQLCLSTSGLTCTQVAASEGWRWHVCETTVPLCQGVGVATSECDHCCECFIDTDCGAGFTCLLDTHTCAQFSGLTCAEYGAHQGWGQALCQRPGQTTCNNTGVGVSGCDYCCECGTNDDCHAGTTCLPGAGLCADARALTCDGLATASNWGMHACEDRACTAVGRETIDCPFCCCLGAGCE
jgi:hypothetical protein